MKSTIKSVEAIELLLDELEVIQLISILEHSGDNDFRSTLLWHLKTLLKNLESKHE